MGRSHALADLHLSGSGAKPMDVFGELWVGHAERMAASWDARVDDNDVVLLPGDLSWARSLAEAEPDLAWIAARPGTKILLRGNHDGWWTSQAKTQAALPPRCRLLHNNAVELDDCVVVGSRGWTEPDDPIATEADHKVFRRELERLRLSLVDADRQDRERGRVLPRIAMTHYPPWLLGRPPSPMVPLLVRGGVRLCVYGHLHGDDHRLALTGVHEGIEFRFVAADAVEFTPVALQVPH